MMDRARVSTAAVVACSLFLALAAVPSTGQAAEKMPQTIRGGHTEIFVFAQGHGNDSAGNGDSVAELDDAFMWGGGLGFNIDERLNFNTALWGGENDMTLTSGSAVTMDDTTLFGWDFNLDVSLFEYCITPVVSGGIGMLWIQNDLDTEFEGKTNFSQNVGAGLRWDFGKHWMLKAMYRAWFADLEGQGNIILHGINVTAGWVF
jgi:opacity protein-like surface antigen